MLDHSPLLRSARSVESELPLGDVFPIRLPVAEFSARKGLGALWARTEVPRWV